MYIDTFHHKGTDDNIDFKKKRKGKHNRAGIRLGSPVNFICILEMSPLGGMKKF